MAGLDCVEHKPELDILGGLGLLDQQLDIGLGKEKNEGAPGVLIISSSAVGCLPFISGIKSNKGKWKVVKLFAKHIKLGEQQHLLQKPVSIGIGTPNRIMQLVCT